MQDVKNLRYASTSSASGRDLRLDFFRGLALIFIFLDHIPENAAAWLTMRNFGFSDAGELFVFLSGYSAALAYGSRMVRSGVPFGIAATLRRAWTIYVAHVFLVVVLIVLSLLAGRLFANPMYLENAQLPGFVNEPLEGLLQALLLRFRAGNVDVLPLYVLLMIVAGPMLALMLRRPWTTLGLSSALWALASVFNWNLVTYPEGGAWLFNPFCWQFIFVAGSFFAMRGDVVRALQDRRTVLLPLAAAYLALSLGIVLTWYFPRLEAFVPDWFARLIYPISKSNLDVLRLLHFLSVAYIVSCFVAADAAWLATKWSRPFLLCGRHSLQIFCVGVVLSFLCHVYLVEYGDPLLAQWTVSAVGSLLLFGLAALMNWYELHPRGGARGVTSASSVI